MHRLVRVALAVAVVGAVVTARASGAAHAATYTPPGSCSLTVQGASEVDVVYPADTSGWGYSVSCSGVSSASELDVYGPPEATSPLPSVLYAGVGSSDSLGAGPTYAAFPSDFTVNCPAGSTGTVDPGSGLVCLGLSVGQAGPDGSYSGMTTPGVVTYDDAYDALPCRFVSGMCGPVTLDFMGGGDLIAAGFSSATTTLPVLGALAVLLLLTLVLLGAGLRLLVRASRRAR